MTRSKLAASLFTALLALAGSLAAQTTPFTLTPPLASNALSSCTDLSLSGQVVVDSAGLSTTIGSNSGNVVSNGNIKVVGQSIVNGNATAGPGKGVQTSGKGSVTGTSGVASTAYDCTPIDLTQLATTLKTTNDNSKVPLSGKGTKVLNGTDFTIDGQDSITLPAGTYYFTSFKVTGGAKVLLAGAVRILCTGGVTVNGGAALNYDASASTHNPFLLHFWSSGATSSLANSTTYGFFYMPAAAATIVESHLVGTLFANAITVSGNSHVTRMIDDVAPRVTITAPANNAIIADGSKVVVTGTAFDDQTGLTLKVNGNPVTVNADGSWTTTLNLSGASSPATITALVTDIAGNTATAKVTIQISPAPIITLVSPAPGSLVNTQKVNLAGSAGTAASVTVNGQAATVAGGNWTLANFDLGTDGAHLLTIVGTSAGGSSTITPTITNDTTPPTIQGTITPAPNAAGWNNSNVTVTFACSDTGSSIATCQAPITVSTEGAGQIVTGTAVDKAGNTATAHVTVNLDKTTPHFTFTSHTNNQIVTTPQITISGGSDDAINATVNSAAATVNTSAKTFTSAPLTLVEKSNSIIVSGKDVAGNTGTATINIVLDNIPPHVAISSPANNAVVSGDPAHVVVSGTTGDDQTSVTSVKVNDHPVTLNADGTWTITLDLSAGSSPATITAVATDAAGNTANASISVVTIPPPVLSLISPAPGSLVKTRTVNLSGSAGTATTVTVNGLSATVASGGWTLANFDLGVDGAHTLTIVGTNAGGSSTITPTLTVDTTPPTITATASPAANGAGWNNGDVTVTFTCSDSGSGIATCQAPITISTEGASQTVSGTATDKAGNSATASLTLKIDKTAPAFTFTSHHDNQIVNTPQVVITGGSDDAITATVNGQTATINTPAKTFTSPAITLTEGNNAIVVTGKDVADNSGTATITLNLDDIKPHVAITSPANNATVPDPKKVVISGTASDDQTAVASIQVNGNPATVAADGTWTITLDLSAAASPIDVTVVATDVAGNFTTTKISVITLPPPTLTLTLPPPGSYVNLHTVALSGGAGSADSVTVNGQPATVANSAWSIASFDLGNDGPVTLTITGTNAGGSTTITPSLFVDTVPPQIQAAVSPAPNAAGWNNTNVTVTFTCVDSGSGIATCPGAANVTTEAAGQIITGTAVDKAGNTAAVRVTLNIDKTAPHFTFTSHTNNQIVTAPKVTIVGGSDDAIAATVNGVAAVIDPAAKTFTATLTLVEGSSSIVVTGSDIAGNSGSATRTLVVDTKAPQISITSPAADACLNTSTLDIKGTASDTNFKNITVQLGGTTVTPVVDASGNWLANFPNVPEGKALFTVTATDTVGHTATSSLTVNIDRTAPAIAFTEGGVPFAATLLNRGVTPLVRVTDADPAPVLTVTLDGAAYAAGTSIAAEGQHTLDAVATDCAGNRNEKSVQFTIDRTPPTLSNFTPANGAALGALPSSIQGTASEPSTISVAGGAAVQTGASNNFTLSGVPFANGINKFTVHAVDAAGNTSDTAYTVTVRTGAPIVTISDNGTPIASGTVFSRAVSPVITADSADDTITALLDGNTFNLGTAITADGNHTLIATAKDPVGHTTNATVTFTIDRTAPSIKITSPADGATIDADTATITGTAGDAVAVSVNGTAATISSGHFTANVLIEPASTSIIAIGSDAAGNQGRDQITINRAGTATGVLLTYPPDGMRTNRPTTVVTGRVLTPSSVQSLTLEGHIASGQSTGTTQVTRDPSGSFTVTNFALFEGVDTITATTTTAEGKTASAVIHVNVDLTPPTVQLLAGGAPLDDGAHFPSATTLTATAADAPIAGFTQGPTTVTLQVDGVAATQPATVSANGGHTAVAIATDGVGNQTRIQRAFFIGTTAGTAGCGLAGFDPADGSVVTANSTTLVGRSGGAAGVKINGIPAQIANGMFAGTVELSQEGANSVTIVCTDASGAPTGTPATITLNRVTAAPSITIDSPAEGTFAGTDTITVGGTVQNASSVDVNGAAATVTGSTYSVANVRLAAGLNILVAHAKNAAGAVAIASRRVVYLKNPPTISIAWPIDGLSTGATSIDISGTYTNLDPASLHSSPAGTVDAHAWSDTTGYFVIHGVPLATGTQPVTVTGHDALNNPVSVTVNVTQTAGAPSITIISPANNSYLPAGPIVPVNGAFNGPTGSQIDVNGSAAATADFTALTYSGTAPFAASGPTIITAHLSQPDGNAAIATVIVNALTAAPTVKAVFPDSGASATDPGVMVLVSFSSPMDEASLRGAFTLLNASNTAVTGQFRLEKDVLSFAPATTLTPGVAYTIDIKTSAKDLAGNALNSEFTSKFTIATSAPTTPPSVSPVASPICASSVAISGTAPAASRIEVDLNGVPTYATTDSTGNYTATLTIPQVSGYYVARVRIIGADGTFSPSAPVSFQVDCSGAQVLGATYDRTANAISVTFSKAIDVSTVTIGPAGSTQLALNDGTQLSGTVAAGSSASSILITPSAPSGAADPRTSTIILTITTGVKDTTGRNLTTPFGQTFTASGQPQQTPNDGTGYISGQILDATNGRLLGGASVSIDVPVTALKNSRVSATSITTPLHGTAKVASTSDSTGHYTSRLPEGAYAIHAAANGYTDVYRQVVVPAGQGIIPIDIRLTRRGSTVTTAGSDLTLMHGGDDTLTRKATLTIPSAAAASGTVATLTAVGGQGLPGLLPLGWSPLAAAEIHLVTPAATPMSGATASLAFQLSSDVASSGRTISAATYDAARDEWDVVQPVVSIGSNGVASINVALPATSADATGANSGTAAIALVYPDIAPYAAPPAPVAGGSLTGIADPCAAGACPQFTAKSFTLNPPIVTPNQRTVATLVIDGTATTTPQFPSGTAIDALVNEELRLVDGSVLTDQPFSTDLILYRSLDTKSATADFHLAPSAKASQVTLQIGFDHIQILPYPGRLDRGTLIGPAGGRVPSDEQVQINIPTGATAEALHATASSMTTNDFAQFGSIDGFQIVGGFTLTLDPATTAQQPFASTQLIKPANATFTVDPAVVGSAPQLILAEVVPQTTFGRIFRLADPMAAPLPIESSTLLHVTTATINAAALPVDGIVRPGQYLLLLARQPIAFATGTVSLSTGNVVAGAAVVSSAIGVRDLSRTTGIYNVPVIAKPGAPFGLTPLHPTLGDGVPYTATASPDRAAIVPVGLTFTFQPPALQSVTVTGPQGGINLVTNNGAVGISLSTGVQAVFSQSLDPASVTPGSITVTNANGQTVKGTTTASGPALTWTLAPGTKLAVSSNYSLQISGSVRGTHGAPFGSTSIYTFSSVTQITSTQINASKIRIVIPDANGISTIIGDPGALPTVPPEASVWSVVARRRDKDFVTQYQAQAHTDGSFSVTIGTCGGSGNCVDSVTIRDHIDLEILNAAQNIAAIIPLTPFVTADGQGVLAASDTATDFTTKDGVTIHVPAGAFAQPTVVHVVPSDKQPLEAVPSFDHDLAFAAGVNLQFDGVANKRIDVEIPVPAGFTPPANELMLGWLGQSSRGPRIMIIDTIRIANNKFTTVDDTVTSSSARRPATKSVLVGRDVKKYLLGVERSGIYAVVDITVPIASGFAIFDSMQKGYDLFWDTLASLYAADFYMVEGRGRVAIPVLAGTPFTIEGVDTTTGFTMFKKQYPNADSGVIESPNPDVTGPYPVFATPTNVQQVDLVDQDTYVRNFYLQYNGTQVSIGNNPNESADVRLREGARVQALNTANGQSLDPVAVQSDGTFNLGSLNAAKGDRIILIAGVADVTAGTDMSVVFNEPIDASGDLHTLITLTATNGTTKIDLTSQLAFNVDSASRRIRMALPSGQLIAGARYDITLKKEIKDLAGNILGIGVLPGTTTASGGNRDLILSFRVRERAAVLGQFEIVPSSAHTGGTVRDMAQWGGLLFISALDGGLLAYDMANPAALKPGITGDQPKPLAFVPAKWADPISGQSITPGFDEHWAVATDRHGRVWATGFMSNFAVLRSYRVEDFLKAAGSTGSCAGSPDAPAGSLCTYHGSAIIGWRPGYSSSLDLASGTLLSDRVEATPRKMQVVLQDDEEPYTFDTFKSTYSPSVVEVYPNNFERWNVNVTYNPSTTAAYYLVQRITIENTTRDLRWSIDVPAGQTVPIADVVAQKGDQIKVYRNQRTWGVVSQFGYGISIFDLNAIDSNSAPNKPAGYKDIRTQITVTSADAASSCYPITSGPGQIQDLALSPEATLIPTSDSSALAAYATDVHSGVLGVGVDTAQATDAAGTTKECIFRNGGLVFYDRASNTIHPRLAAIKAKFTTLGRFFNVRYGSVAYYHGLLAGQPADYVLISAGDLGVLVLQVGPPGSPMAGPDQLAGVIWVPQGVYGIRVIPNSHLATMVDGAGRALIVDLTNIDERYDANGNLTSGLFKTASDALNATPLLPGLPGIDDPRIVWASDPGFMQNTMPPIVDPNTGILIAGDLAQKSVRVVPAIDPKIRMMIDRGDAATNGLTEVDGVAPLGFDPRSGLLTGPNGSAAAFRIAVSLPAGAAKALQDAGSNPEIAVESEWTPGVETAQTPVQYPKAHLRTKAHDGTADPRATTFILHRDLPSNVEEQVRYQSGATRYVSDWIVAIGDPRASEKWNWPSGTNTATKATAGCASCDRPTALHNLTEQQHVYELWTAGRYITVRPDGAIAANVLAGTPYEYLGKQGRLTARFTTTRARKVRPTEVLVPAQNPPVADGMLQETHYVHSGEVETSKVDLDAGGRAGVDVAIARHYRSRTIGGTELGEGWDSPMFRFVLPLPNGDLEYHDGAGEIWKFKLDINTGSLVAPRGLFLKLIHTPRGYSMLDQKWRIAEFNDLGQLVSESDEFYSPAQSDSGNIIRYLYDENGKMNRIIDPLGRTTKLTYEKDRLSQVDSEWRHRTLKYHYDDFGRLIKVELPEVKAGTGVPSTYDHSGNNRPVIQYGYRTNLTPPQANEPLQSQPYTDFAEFLGNLITITDPEQVQSGGQARVTFGYDFTTGTNRDHNLSQTWATGETAYFEPDSHGYLDVLGQKRSYTLTDPALYDGRRHISSKRVLDVPLMDAAAAGLPDIISPLLTTTNHPKLETQYGFNDDGLITLTTFPNNLVEHTENWTAANGAPGFVLTSKKAVGPLGEFIETSFGFDSASNATANLSQIGRRDNNTPSFVYRDSQTPSRGRTTIETNDTGVQSRAIFNKNGQIEHAENGDGPGNTSIRTVIDYHPSSTSNPIESGRPWHISRGNGDIHSTSTYSMTPDGVETEVTTDDIRLIVTTIVKDVDGRVVSRKVQAPQTSTALGASPSVTEETFGYNADGKVAYQTRLQNGVPIITTLMYDALDRQVGSETTGVKLLGSPTISGSEIDATLKTKTKYDMASRQITEFAPFRVDETSAPRTITTLDGLGRATLTQSTSASGNLFVKKASYYDLSGKKAYETDLTRSATLTQNDVFGRPIAAIRGDGTRTQVAWDAWDEPVETIGFKKKTGSTLEQNSHSRSIFTADGRLRLSTQQIDAAGRSRGTGMSWQQGDAITTQRVGEISFSDAAIGPSTTVRVRQSVRDSAGRVTDQISGEAAGPEALVDPSNTFAETRVTQYVSDLAMKIESVEPRAGRKSVTTIDYDGIGRPILTIEAGGAYTSSAIYDEAGNALITQSAGMQPVQMQYDARGLLLDQRFVSGKHIHRIYDELNTARQYIDEQGQTTFTDVDELGRVTKTRYPDGTTEETLYENGTGVVQAHRDRAGRWVWFKYDDNNDGRLTEQHHGGNGPTPLLTSNPFIRFSYDDASRITRIASADAAIEYDNFDLMGRPQVTRTIRYKKTGCIPAIAGCGAGLVDSTQIAEVYTQGHVWSVFDGERSRWRLPVAGSSLPAPEVDTPWRNWIDEQRDGAGNLVRQQEALSQTGTAGGDTVTQAIGRGVGRLAQRQRGNLLTRFGYADASDSSASSVVPTTPPSPGAPLGGLGRAESLIGSRTVAGSEITLGAKKLIASAKDLGLDARNSSWQYTDDRGWLQQSILLQRDGATANLPTAGSPTSDAALVTARDITPPRLGATDLGNLANPSAVVPLTWTADQIGDGNQIQHRNFSTAGLPAGDQTFTWTAGRRDSNGVWTLSYDDRGRVVAKESTDRRIVYDYDPNDRVVGRIAYQKDASSTWTIETRTNVLARDGLPAETSFVWDPLADRLVAMFDSAAVRTAAPLTAETGLLRQYVHGESSYDDPVDVLIAAAAGQTPQHFLPILDEAGTGSLQAVADASGKLVERVLYADSYGDAPHYLQGAVADRVNVSNDAGARTISIHFTEAVDATTIASGAVATALDASGNSIATLSTAPSLTDDHTVTWKVDGATWSTFTQGAQSVRISVTNALRFPAWGTTPLQPVADWETILGRASSLPGAPFVKTAQLSEFDGTQTLYDVPDLYLVGRSTSVSNLLFDFHGLPFRDPADGLIFARARWYDPSTSSFISDDPLGYKDSSNLYAYAANNPVGRTDPTGESFGDDLWDVTKAGLGVVAGTVVGIVETSVDMVKGAFFATYNGVGAMAYEATGNQMYRAQYDAHMRTTEAINNAVGHPINAAQALWSGVKQPFEQAAAAGDTFQVGFELGKQIGAALAPIAAEKAVGAISDGLLAGARTGTRIAAEAEMEMEARGARAATASEARVPVSRAESALMEEASGAEAAGESMRPCPIGLCLIGSTAITTPIGKTPIEDLRVGDRVASTFIDSSRPDGWTAVDSVDWHVVTLRMANPQHNDDSYEIEMLRPVQWIVAHEAYPGHTIELATERNANDQAYVIGVAPAPHIAPGSGRVVLATYAHHDEIVSIHFDGAADPVDSSPWHRFYSRDRIEWIDARNLRVGEHIRTKSGISTITAIDHKPGAARVFDLEVEGDHAYYVADAQVLTHNCGREDVAFGRTRPEREALAANRPERFRKGVVEKVWENAEENGRVFDPNTTEELTWDRAKSRHGQWDMGHRPEASYDQLKKRFINGEISRKDFLNEYNNPANYRPEAYSTNRSRRFN
jgi:RHS repeat-associated protein